jgi:hypothetical protein
MGLEEFSLKSKNGRSRVNTFIRLADTLGQSMEPIYGSPRDGQGNRGVGAIIGVSVFNRYTQKAVCLIFEDDPEVMKIFNRDYNSRNRPPKDYSLNESYTHIDSWD